MTYPLLGRIQAPGDVKRLQESELPALCEEIRQFLIESVSATGGHLSSWREEDQVSNNKLTSFGISLLKLCGRYLAGKQKFVTREWREKPIENYTSSVIASNL